MQIIKSLSWKEILTSRYKYLLIFTIVLLVILRQINLNLLISYQHRSLSIYLYDPVLHLIRPVDVGFWLFLSSYTAFGVAIIYFIRKPRQFTILLQALMLMWMMRWLTIYLLPLAVPPMKIPLHDPIAYFNHVISRDLFFSGHTASLVIMLCVSRQRWLRLFFIFFLALTVTLLLLGHQHYFLDIVAAPFFAYGCYRLALTFNDWITPLLTRNLS